MDHTKRQDAVCHIQTKRGPLSHRIVESISVLTESGLRNTGMLSRERLSSDLRFFFQKYQTRKTSFCVPKTTTAANGRAACIITGHAEKLFARSKIPTPRVITEYTLNNATRTTSASEVVLFANGNTLLICLRIRI